MSINGNRASRITPGGYWKATAVDAPVYSRRHIIGQKKTLCFYQGAKLTKKTNWIMHEFRISNEVRVLCKVFERNIGSNATRQRETAEQVPNHANEEQQQQQQQQQNEEALSTIVPAVVTHNTNKLQQPIITEQNQNQDFLAPMVPSEMVMPNNKNHPLQQIDQDSSCPDFYFDVDRLLHMGIHL